MFEVVIFLNFVKQQGRSDQRDLVVFNQNKYSLPRGFVRAVSKGQPFFVSNKLFQIFLFSDRG